MNRRVAVTGLGCVTPLGADRETTWRGAVDGVSGIRPLTDERTAGLPVKLAAVAADFDPLRVMSAKEARRADRYAQLALAAADEAMRDSGLALGANADELRTGVWIGSGVGGIATFEAGMTDALRHGYDRVSPFALPMFLPNTAASSVAIRFGAKGIAACTATACSSGSQSIG